MRSSVFGPSLLLALVATGCRRPTPASSEQGWELRFELVAPGDRSAEGAIHRDSPVTRRGRREAALVLVAPVTARAELPGGLKGRVRLRALASPVFNIGDGVELQLTSVAQVTGADAGGRRTLYRGYFDAGRRASDRSWTELDVLFELPGGGPSSLELQLAAGPQGNLVGDWLALARLRIVPE